jgi:predicted RNA-binding protein YlqC (UPF0109 family)
MEDFISFIVKHLVDNPDAVSVENVDREGGRCIYRLHVGAGDLGQVIGKEGKTAKSIRTLVIAAAARKGLRAGFEIVDPERDNEPGTDEGSSGG